MTHPARWRIWMAGAVLLFLCLSAAPFLFCRNTVTLDRYRQVRHAMAHDEVVRILGQPHTRKLAKGYVKGPDHFILTYGFKPGLGPHLDFPSYSWETEDLTIHVMFSPNGRVIYRNCTVKPRNPTPWYDRFIRPFKKAFRR